jgi:dolichol-phosphate mannosyltransferase/undecaprenyl-phosphate 4-deoxy-4-formamido-L-arabinose transferase
VQGKIGMRRRLVSVVIPVYGSPALDALTARIEEVFRGRPEDYEIVFVEDASPDESTWPALERLAGEREHVRAIQLSRNFGQHAATLCGLREARGDVMITLDDDLQHDPGDIPLLLAESDHDIVIAQFVEKRHPLHRRIGSAAKSFFDGIIFGKPKHVRLSSFRLLSRTVVDGMLSVRTPRPFIPALMFHVSRDVAGVTVRHSSRAGGRSGYTFRKLFRLFTDLVINNSSILLRASASVGLSISLISFVLAAVVIQRRLVHRVSVQGWASLFTALLLIGGLLLFSVGIVGEYLIRIIESSEGRPMYFVRRRSG